MNKNLKILMQKEVTRKEFVQYMGLGIVTLLGLSNFLSLLQHMRGRQMPNPYLDDPTKRSGFGASRFGV